MGKRRGRARPSVAPGTSIAGGASRAPGELVRWTLSDAEHRAYRKHLGQGGRWSLPIRVALAIAIAAGMTWAAALVAKMTPQVFIAGGIVGAIILVGTMVYGGREPKVLPSCLVIMAKEGYASAGARQPWAVFGGIESASVFEHADGVLVVRVVGQKGWAELPLTVGARAGAEAACSVLLAGRTA